MEGQEARKMREKSNWREVVGIWVRGRLLCFRCGGADWIVDAYENDRVQRFEVEKDGGLNRCDNCGGTLI